MSKSHPISLQLFNLLWSFSSGENRLISIDIAIDAHPMSCALLIASRRKNNKSNNKYLSDLWFHDHISYVFVTLEMCHVYWHASNRLSSKKKTVTAFGSMKTYIFSRKFALKHWRKSRNNFQMFIHSEKLQNVYVLKRLVFFHNNISHLSTVHAQYIFYLRSHT